MKPGIPWSVKGIGNEAREAAKFAARKSGMSLGEWLNEMILDQADEETGGQSDALDLGSSPAEPAGLSLENLAEQLSRLTGREQEAARFTEPQPVAQQAKQSSDALARVLQRLETGERQSAAAFSAVNDRIAALSTQVAQTAKYRPPERPEDVPGYSAIEGALRNIVDHIQANDKRSRDSLTALQERMGDMAERAASADDERVRANATALSGLEGRLAELATRLERNEGATTGIRQDVPALIEAQLGKFGERLDYVREIAERSAQRTQALAQQDLPKLFETELGKVGERIDQARLASADAVKRADGASAAASQIVQQELPRLIETQLGKFDQRFDQRLDQIRQTSEQAAQRAQSAAIQTAQQELRGFEGRVQTVMKEAQLVIRQSAINASTEVDRVKSTLEAVNQRIDDMTSNTASEREVETLREAMEQLSMRVSSGSDMRPVVDLDRRVSELTARIERMQQNSNSLAPQLLDLDRRVQQIDGGIREMMSRGIGSANDTTAIEQYISQLNERLNRTEQHLGNFGAIEQSLHQLFASIEQSKGLAQAAAEDAASRMGESLMQTMQQSVQQSMQQAIQHTMLSVQQQQEQQQQALRQQFEQQHQLHQHAVQQQQDQQHQQVRLQLEQQHQLQQQVMQQQIAQLMPAASAQPAEPSAELRALQDGLAAVRASAAQADRRNQETLEAVHETLEQIVTKLAELEAVEPQPEAPAAPVVQQAPEKPQNQNPFASFFEEPLAPPPQPQFAPPPVMQPQHQQMQAEPLWPQPLEQQAQPANPFAQDFGAQAYGGQPQAPAWPAPPPQQQQQPQVFDQAAYAQAMQQQAYAQQQQAQPQFQPNLYPDQMGAGGGDDYISAARRAAQSAAVVQAAQAEIPAGGMLGKARGLLGGTKGGASRFSLPFAVKTEAAATPVAVAGVQLTTGSARRKKLILAGLVLLAALSAFGVSQLFRATPNLQSQLPDKPALSAPAEQPATATAKQPAVEAPAVNPAVEDADPSGAAGPRPKPAELESGKLEPKPETSGKAALESVAALTDNLLTGALPGAKSDATIESIVGAPDPNATTGELPPAEVGSDSLRKAASAGDPAAQFIVASRYLDGKQVEQDFTRAAHWYQKAAVQGLAPAQYRLATLFERGRGVPQDIATAGLWYERAAERGNVKAMHNAAVIFSSNQAGAPDYEKAAIWFRGAAEHGLKDSQYNFAVLLERGLGLKQNMGEALFWYTLAAGQDDKDAAKKVQMLEQSLAPATVGEARDRVKSWQAKPAVQESNMVPVSEQAWNAVPQESGLPVIAAALHEVRQPSLVETAQSELVRLGYNVPTNGEPGAKTANAVRLFQLKSGLKVTGDITPELVQKLRGAKS